jgi:hypothetical protein
MENWGNLNRRQRAEVRKTEAQELLKEMQSCGEGRGECLGPALMYAMMQKKYPRDCPKNSPTLLEILGAQLSASRHSGAHAFLAKHFCELGLVDENEMNALRAEMQKGENGNGKKGA